MLALVIPPTAATASSVRNMFDLICDTSTWKCYAD
jgi:hypothetical protein